MASYNDMANGNSDWRIWAAIVGVVFGSAGAGFSGGSLSRTDPFTGSQGELLRQELKIYSDTNRISCEKQITDLARRLEQLPPAATKDRIIGIEEFLREHNDYHPPTYKWHD